MSDLVGNPEDRFSRVAAQLFVCLFVCLLELWLSILIDSCGYVGTLVIFQNEFCYSNVGFLTHRQNNQQRKPKGWLDFRPKRLTNNQMVSQWDISFA